MKHRTILAALAISMAAYGADFPYNSGAPADAFQIGMMSNLAIGDSVVNITNGGINGVGTTTLSSAICANLYVFDPGGTMLACCSTRLPANALRSYSARNDLIPTSLVGVPTSIVVKFVATDPVDNICTNSAAVANATLAGGLAVSATTIHALPVTAATPATTYGVTNSPFALKILGNGEYQKLTGTCNAFVQAGTGDGICHAARVGGL